MSYIPALVLVSGARKILLKWAETHSHMRRQQLLHAVEAERVNDPEGRGVGSLVLPML